MTGTYVHKNGIFNEKEKYLNPTVIIHAKDNKQNNKIIIQINSQQRDFPLYIFNIISHFHKAPSILFKQKIFLYIFDYTTLIIELNLIRWNFTWH